MAGASLGVDVSLGRGHDVVLMEDSVVKEAWSRVGADRLRQLLGELRPAVVAIDSPPKPGLGLLRDREEAAKLPVPPRAGTHLSRRVAEYELSRRGIGSHQTHYDETRLFSWMTAGFEAFDAAAAAGYALWTEGDVERPVAIEVFPYASYVTLAGCLSPGRRWRLAWRTSVLLSVGVMGLPEGASIDTVDAACAAFTGQRFVEGAATSVGDPREGAIVLPVSRIEERYRRCAEGSLGRGEGRERLCACGCGRPVTKRFLPGHDSKLRSRLLRDVRAGQRASVEMRKLGWRVPEPKES